MGSQDESALPALCMCVLVFGLSVLISLGSVTDLDCGLCELCEAYGGEKGFWIRVLG